jgi:hypothetical protein
MANDYIPRPAARFHAWLSNSVTYVNGHPPDLVLAGGDPPPANPGGVTLLLLTTRTPSVAQLTGPDGGKTTHCMPRWVATTGEKRQWSDTPSATIGA